jgi:hypothetical protein
MDKNPSTIPAYPAAKLQGGKKFKDNGSMMAARRRKVRLAGATAEIDRMSPREVK